jgi:hypothetical protein
MRWGFSGIVRFRDGASRLIARACELQQVRALAANGTQLVVIGGARSRVNETGEGPVQRACTRTRHGYDVVSVYDYDRKSMLEVSVAGVWAVGMRVFVMT